MTETKQPPRETKRLKPETEAFLRGVVKAPTQYSDGWRELAEVERRYRQLAQQVHPDKGGTDGEMARLNVAIDSARAELGA